MTIESEYSIRHTNYLTPSAKLLNEYLITALNGVARIDRISTRAKNPDRFVAKALKKSQTEQINILIHLPKYKIRLAQELSLFIKTMLRQ